MRVATLGRYRIQGIPEPKKVLEQSIEPVKKREVTPTPSTSKKGSAFNTLVDLARGPTSPLKTPAPTSPQKPAGPTALFQEN